MKQNGTAQLFFSSSKDSCVVGLADDGAFSCLSAARRSSARDRTRHERFVIIRHHLSSFISFMLTLSLTKEREEREEKERKERQQLERRELEQRYPKVLFFSR